MRQADVKRQTKETDINLFIDLDGKGNVDIDTGIGFFDHMLTALAVHAGFDLTISCKGDLGVDSHHTIEDVGIVLGQAFLKAIGDCAKIARYGSALIPMDESLAQASIDIGGRAYLVFNASFLNGLIGSMDSQMIEEFFRAFTVNAQLTLHLNLLYGKNDHHKAEALFKAAAYAIKTAILQTSAPTLSTKGMV